MSLVEAVKDIVEQMEEFIEEPSADPQLALVFIHVKGFARQLRSALKTSAGNSSVLSPLPSPELQYAQMLAKSREEFKTRNQHVETIEPRMTLIADGPEQDAYVGVAQDMPIGARTWVNGVVYELRQDGLLHCCELILRTPESDS